MVGYASRNASSATEVPGTKRRKRAERGTVRGRRNTFLAAFWPAGHNIGMVPDIRGTSFFNFGSALYLTVLLRARWSGRARLWDWFTGLPWPFRPRWRRAERAPGICFIERVIDQRAICTHSSLVGRGRPPLARGRRPHARIS